MRARGLKPGVFKNEALAEIVPPWGRLLFMGLWGLADREGRLLDRPGHIAVEIFPYDLAQGRLSISQVEEIVTELAKGSDPFILRYTVREQKIIQIVNFAKHQSPHKTERASELPPYQGLKKRKQSKKLTLGSRKSHGDVTVDPRKSHGGNRPDSGLLITDSLTPDSGQLTADGKDIAPPGTPVDALKFFSCPFFEVDFDYRMKLAKEYPALTDEILVKEFSKMEDWITDNKRKKKFKANGHLGNPRLFIKNWLDRVQVNGSEIFGKEPNGFAALRESARRRGNVD